MKKSSTNIQKNRAWNCLQGLWRLRWSTWSRYARAYDRFRLLLKEVPETSLFFRFLRFSIHAKLAISRAVTDPLLNNSWWAHLQTIWRNKSIGIWNKCNQTPLLFWLIMCFFIPWKWRPESRSRFSVLFWMLLPRKSRFHETKHPDASNRIIGLARNHIIIEETSAFKRYSVNVSA